MPKKVAILFFMFLLAVTLTNSYAQQQQQLQLPEDITLETAGSSIPKQIEFASDIIKVDPDFFL